MAEIPDNYKRITEDRVDAILQRHLSSPTTLAHWFFGRAFPKCTLLSIESVSLHQYRDHSVASGDPLAFGETDVEVIATVRFRDRGEVRVGLLLEDKVDAPQADNQGPRYQARARYRREIGSWQEFECILVAPQYYLNNAYPLNDFRDGGWDAIITFEEIAGALQRDGGSSEDARTLFEAAERENAWNKPEPTAVQFWKDLTVFQRFFHPDVPIFANPQQGARINVWPAFYENQLRNNKREIRRKYVQIAHSGSTHVSLFIKNVRYSDFVPVVSTIIEPEMRIGYEGKS